MPYNIKQLGEKSVSIDFFIADPNFGVVACEQESSHASGIVPVCQPVKWVHSVD